MRIPILTFTFILTFSSFLSGQIQKGTWTLGGQSNLAYPGYTSALPNSYDVRLSSNVGYFFSDKFFVEVGLGFKSYAYEWLVNNEHIIPHKDFDINTEVNFRYYINPKQKSNYTANLVPRLTLKILTVRLILKRNTIT